MPYVLKNELKNICEGGPFTRTGELNLALTVTILEYIQDAGGLSYAKINDVLGALEGCKAEFIRRVANPYEAKKQVGFGRVDPYKLMPIEPGSYAPGKSLNKLAEAAGVKLPKASDLEQQLAAFVGNLYAESPKDNGYAKAHGHLPTFHDTVPVDTSDAKVPF